METFGRYELLRKLAAGGMGQVYLARQKGPVGFQKLLVVKRLLPHLSEDDEFITMFLDEARIAALLNHPNIAQIYDLGEVDGIYYIAMEYVHGESINDVNKRATQRKGSMPLALKCRVISDAAAGLDAAHHARSPSGRKLGLIHRDVSPQNVLVGFNGSVKLIDFGVAKAVNKVSHTSAGQIKGKHAYMSPEQAKGESLDPRSDVFGLGTVFYEILTNTRLFKRESEMATLKAVVSAKVPPPSEVVQGIPKALDAVVLKALSKHREERFATAGEMQLAIEDFLIKQQLPSTTAHLAAFMRDIYSAELEEEFSSEPTIIAYDPRLPGRKPPPPMVDESAPTTLVPIPKSLQAEAPTKAEPAPKAEPLPKAPTVSPLPKAPKVPPPPKAREAAVKDDAPRRSSRGGKGEK
ncbi:MAG: serine/threonine protein kinase [Myxococcaceae bacterium]|nr:serine/threonine protein kinase [Myxococcaceae bacterium]